MHFWWQVNGIIFAVQIIILKRFVFTGCQAKNVNLEDELTVLIDTKKYMEIFKRSNETTDCGENEMYQECGTKCVLGCKNAASSAGITLSNDECKSTECVSGCFCKDGLVRHRDKCIQTVECSDRSGKSAQITAEVSGSGAPMRIFGLLRPQQSCGPTGCTQMCGSTGCTQSASNGCGPRGCGIYIHNHNEAINEGAQGNRGIQY